MFILRCDRRDQRKKVELDAIENIEEKIAAAEAAIATMSEELKAKKAELKDLIKALKQKRRSQKPAQTAPSCTRLHQNAP